MGIALVPGFVKGTEPLFGGVRGGYPLDPWELRTVYVVEAIPRHTTHPYGRKVFCFDQQTFAPFYTFAYDQQGKLWRTEFLRYANPDFYPGGKDVRVPILIGRSWLDYISNRVILNTVTGAVYNQPLPAEFFTKSNMIQKGH